MGSLNNDIFTYLKCEFFIRLIFPTSYHQDMGLVIICSKPVYCHVVQQTFDTLLTLWFDSINVFVTVCTGSVISVYISNAVPGDYQFRTEEVHFRKKMP